LGALGLGLAGCGGGGDEGFPTNIPPVQISIPTSALPVAQTATNPQPVPAGQGAVVNAPTVDQNQNPGVTAISIQVPTGKTLQDTTLAVQLIPDAQSTVAKIRAINPNSVAGITPIVEFAFGPVGTNGKIDVSRPIVFGSGVATIHLTAAEADAIQASLNAGKTITVRRAGADGLNVADVTATLGRDANNLPILILNGLDSGEFVVSIENTVLSTHNQGRVG